MASIVVPCVLYLSPALGIVTLVLGLIGPDHTAGELARQSLRIKLTHMLFYILLFLAFWVLPVAVALFFLFDAMALTAGSGFGIAAILRARKEGRLTTGRAIGHIIAHCFFVADVISAFLLWRKLKNQ